MSLHSTHFEGTTSGQFVTTTYVPSAESTTLPSAQIIDIVEEYVLPAISADFTLYKRSAVLNSILATNTPPVMYLDSVGGEVATLVSYDVEHVPVVLGKTEYEDSIELDGTAISDSITTQFLNVYTTSSGSSPPLGFSSWVAPTVTYKSRETNLVVEGGVPLRVNVPAGSRPQVRVTTAANDVDVLKNGVLTVRKVWGKITFDSFVQRDVPTTDAVTKAITWTKVFQTIGKVIKMVAKVAEIVIPFALAFAKQGIVPAEFVLADRRLTAKIRKSISSAPKRSTGKVQKRKAPKSKTRKSKKTKVNHPQ